MVIGGRNLDTEPSLEFEAYVVDKGGAVDGAGRESCAFRRGCSHSRHSARLKPYDVVARGTARRIRRCRAGRRRPSRLAVGPRRRVIVQPGLALMFHSYCSVGRSATERTRQLTSSHDSPGQGSLPVYARSATDVARLRTVTPVARRRSQPSPVQGVSRASVLSTSMRP